MFEDSFNFAGESAGAGGFVNSTNQFASQAQGSAKKSFPKRERAQDCMPVTVRQVLECDGEKIKIHHVEADMITMVGVVKSSNTVSTKVTYEFEDHTGLCEINQYVETEADKQHSPTTVVEGNYYRVIGNLRSQNGKNFVLAFRVIPVSDPNEITSHLLELVFAHLKIPQLAAKNAQTQGNVGATPALPNSFTNSAIGMSNSISNAGNNSGMTSQQLIVYNIIRSATMDEKPEGVGRNEMYSTLRDKLNASDINTIVDFLSQEGHIYSTIDENHFKSTDS